MSRRRVVVTGIGMLSPIGNDVDTSWAAALAGKSGAGLIETFDTTDYPARIAAMLKDFDPSTYLDKKEIRRIDSFIQYGLVAGIQAIADAALPEQPEDG